MGWKKFYIKRDFLDLLESPNELFIFKFFNLAHVEGHKVERENKEAENEAN